MYQISFSGGLGSGISALLAYENGLDFNLIFADTLIEDEDLYRFNADIAKAVGKEIPNALASLC
jgi:3'-phosphoadenosine 5'-phosphosulfate sulfotransferase (PAPS reductase)/FAD synthetase